MCGSAARTELYGGQLAIAVPTVTERAEGDILRRGALSRRTSAASCDWEYR